MKNLWLTYYAYTKCKISCGLYVHNFYLDDVMILCLLDLICDDIGEVEDKFLPGSRKMSIRLSLLVREPPSVVILSLQVLSRTHENNQKSLSTVCAK